MPTNHVKIHPTAVIDPRAELASDVEVGPFAVVGPRVRIGARTRIASHVVIEGPTTLGEDNVVHAFAVVGGAPQHKREGDSAGSQLHIGHRNVLREHVTVHRGTEGRRTTLGDDNLLMASSHVAHDVQLASNVTLANGVQLAGHAVVGAYATFGGLSGVAQFACVGEGAFVAAGAMCESDVPPFVIVQGDRARVRALNVVGLERRGVPHASIDALRRAFRVLFGSRVPRAEALGLIDRSDPFVARLAEALERAAAP